MLRKSCTSVGSLLFFFALIRFIWTAYLLMDDPSGYLFRFGGLVSDLVYLFQALALSLLCFFAAHEIQRIQKD